MKNRNDCRIATGMLPVLFAALLLNGVGWAQSGFKTLYTFKGGQDGSGPAAGLVTDAAGNLYGTTQYGGSNKAGTVFRLTPNSGGGWTETTLYDFCNQSNCADGAYPVSPLIFDGLGNLYGTARGGQDAHYCTDGCGVVFELTPSATGDWTESVLYGFTGGADGADSLAGLSFDVAGNLYGTTWQGGVITSFCYDGCGVVFELSPEINGWIESVLHAFMDEWDGSNSWAASPIFDRAGNLYEEGWNGGQYGNGNVFQLSPNGDGTWTENVLHQFKGGKDGGHPQGGLVFDSAGNLYGITRESSPGYGTIFALKPESDGSWAKCILHRFTGGIDGADPYAGVTLDSNGNVYGVTNDGGAHGYGVVFRLKPTSACGGSYRVLHAFKDGPGAYPQGNLIIGNGSLYGTTYGDGSKTFGSVFEITP